MRGTAGGSGSTARALSTAVAGLLAVAASSGLTVPSLYRDNLLVASGWRGNDLVTLVVAVPWLVMTIRRAGRGAITADLAWLGLLDYALYTYLFYLFGAAFNAAFLLYVGIVIAASAALVLGLLDLDVPALTRWLDRPAAPRVAAFFALVAVGLGGFHLALAAMFLVTGAPPALLQATGHPTNVIAALDLWLVVTPSAVAAWGLWRHRPWSVVLAAILAVKGAVYMLALSTATLAAYRAGALADLSQLALWSAIGVGSAVAARALLVTPSPSAAASPTTSSPDSLRTSS